MSKARDLANFISTGVNVDYTELGYLDNVRSNVQVQIDTKAANTYVNTSLGAKANSAYAAANTYVNTYFAALASDNSWTGSQRATNVTDNDGSFDMNAGQNFICTPSGNIALTFTNIANGQTGFIKLINTGGHTISLAATSKADANLTTTVSTASTYILSYYSDGTNVYLTNSAAIA